MLCQYLCTVTVLGDELKLYSKRCTRRSVTPVLELCSSKVCEQLVVYIFVSISDTFTCLHCTLHQQYIQWGDTGGSMRVKRAQYAYETVSYILGLIYHR